MFLSEVSINEGEKKNFNAGMNALNQRVTYSCMKQSLVEGNILKKNPFKDTAFNNLSLIHFFSGKYKPTLSK